MGTYTYANYLAFLKLRLGNNDAFDAYRDEWVNSAYRMLTTAESLWGIKKRLYFPELETSSTATTTDGTAYVSVPSDCLFIREVYDSTNKRRLDWIPHGQYVDKTDRADTTAEGQPLKWTRRGSYIYLWPTPDSSAYTLTIYYKKRVSNLDGSTYNTTVIGTEWDDIILEMAVYFARNWLNEPERAELAKKNAIEMITGLVNVYNTEERARRETVRPDDNSYIGNSY